VKKGVVNGYPIFFVNFLKFAIYSKIVQMLYWKKGENPDVYLTLTEKRTLASPMYWLFHFEHKLTNTIFTKIIADTLDTSEYPLRFNKFLFDVSIFNTAPEGEYIVSIHEQVSPTNIDLANTGRMCQRTQMLLIEPTGFAYTQKPKTNIYNVRKK
jgi:hypothetical protein